MLWMVDAKVHGCTFCVKHHEHNFVGHEQLWRKKKYSGSGFRTNKKERDVELTLSEIGERGVCVCGI